MKFLSFKFSSRAFLRERPLCSWAWCADISTRMILVECTYVYLFSRFSPRLKLERRLFLSISCGWFLNSWTIGVLCCLLWKYGCLFWTDWEAESSDRSAIPMPESLQPHSTPVAKSTASKFSYQFLVHQVARPHCFCHSDWDRAVELKAGLILNGENYWIHTEKPSGHSLILAARDGGD